MVTMHIHLASDGWSRSILVKEVVELSIKASTAENKEAQLPLLPLQYADYAVWQRQYMRDEVALKNKLDYWRK